VRKKAKNVKIETVDKLFSDLKWTSCDFIKLDIENAEFPALVGSSKTMAKYRPIVVFENSPISAANLNGYSSADFFKFFDQLDYEIFDIFLNKFTQERWEKDARLPSYYVALPLENSLFKNKETIKDYDDFLNEFLTCN